MVCDKGALHPRPYDNSTLQLYESLCTLIQQYSSFRE